MSNDITNCTLESEKSKFDFIVSQVLVPDVSSPYGHFSRPTTISEFENDICEKSTESELTSQISSPIMVTEKSPTDSGSENLTKLILDLSSSISDSLDTDIIAESPITPARHSWLSGHSCNTPCIQEINTPIVLLDSTPTEGGATRYESLQSPESNLQIQEITMSRSNSHRNFVNSTPVTRNIVTPRLLRIETDLSESTSVFSHGTFEKVSLEPLFSDIPSVAHNYTSKIKLVSNNDGIHRFCEICDKENTLRPSVINYVAKGNIINHNVDIIPSDKDKDKRKKIIVAKMFVSLIMIYMLVMSLFLVVHSMIPQHKHSPKTYQTYQIIQSF